MIPELDPYARLTVSELATLEQRAWYHAARAWQEYRAATDRETRILLLASANSAEQYWRELHDRRIAAERSAPEPTPISLARQAWEE